MHPETDLKQNGKAQCRGTNPLWLKGMLKTVLSGDKNDIPTKIFNAFATGNPFWGEKLLGISIGRRFGALQGLISPVIQILVPQKNGVPLL